MNHVIVMTMNYLQYFQHVVVERVCGSLMRRGWVKEKSHCYDDDVMEKRFQEALETLVIPQIVEKCVYVIVVGEKAGQEEVAQHGLAFDVTTQ